MGSFESVVELARSDRVLPAFRKLVFGCRESLRGFSMHRADCRLERIYSDLLFLQTTVSVFVKRSSWLWDDRISGCPYTTWLNKSRWRRREGRPLCGGDLRLGASRLSCNARDRENWLESRVTRKSTTLGNRERFKQLSIVLLMACGVWTYDHLHYLIICPDRQ